MSVLTGDSVVPGQRRWNLALLVSIGLAGAVFVGLAVRLWMYLFTPPFWGDEIMLHMNLLRREYGDLAKPLDYGQMAPVLFLWLQKTSMLVLGVGEKAARLLPLLSSVAVIVFTAAVVAKCISRQAAMWAAALASMSPALIQFSNQAKQYIVEAAATSFILWLCVAVVWTQRSYRHVVLLLAGSVAALFVSIPSVFVVTCAWAAFFGVSRRRGDPLRFQAALVASAGLAGAAFIGLYVFVYSGVGKSAFMQGFWTPAYLSSQKSVPDAIRLAVGTVIGTVFSFDDTIPVIVGVLAVLLAGVALYRMVSEQMWPELILIAGPLLLAIAASIAGKWPLATRLMLFASPLVLVLVCKGLDVIAGRLSGQLRYLAVCAILCAFLLPALRYDFYLLRYPALTDNREMVHEIIRRAEGNTVYIFSAGPNGALEWLYYSEDWQQPDWKRVGAWMEMAMHLEDSPRTVDWNTGVKLAYTSDNRRELIGVDSGSYADGTGYRRGPTQKGWAEHEAARILSGGPQRVFIFAPHYRKPPLDELFTVLENNRLHLIEKREQITRWFLFAAQAEPAR